MKIIPLQLSNTNDNIYAGFWPRLGSSLLDFIILLPAIFLVQYLNSFSKDAFFYTLLPNLLLILWYYIYLPKEYGGTPGKLIVGIRIIRLDGKPIDWKEAFLRHSVMLGISLFGSFVMIMAIMQADDSIYQNLPWYQQAVYLSTLTPVLFTIHAWVSNIWIYSEFIVLLTNRRKRAIHDFMANTVIIKKAYAEAIYNEMYPEESPV